MVYLEIRDSNPYTFIYSQLKNSEEFKQDIHSVQLKKFETRNLCTKICNIDEHFDVTMLQEESFEL